MASIVSAGTTSATALNMSADTTGILQLASNNGTVALTISTAQVVTFTNPPTATGGGGVSTNTAYGTGALAATATGTRSSAFGYQALNSMTSGDPNTAFGYFALKLNTGGAANVAMGAYALQTNVSGASNVAVGNECLSLNTASYNTAIGGLAGSLNASGQYNVFIGYQSGDAVTQSGANTFIGNNSGGAYNGSATNTFNTFIGCDSGQLMTTGTKNTILGSYNGNQSSLDIRTASNYVVLSDGDGNPWGWFDGSGNFTCGGGTSADLSSTNYGIGLRARGAGTQIRYNSNGTTDANALVGRVTGTDVIYIKSNNGAVQNSTNSYGGISDLRLKENIADATPKLAELQQVRIVNFNLIRDVNKEKQIGVIAQELELIFPSMVDTSIDKDDDGNDLGTTTKTVKYSVFVPMLIKAIQELNAKVTALENK